MPGQLVGQALASSRIGTGVRRLDELLDGGLRIGESLLVCGPPFSGKRFLLDHAVGAAPEGVEPIAVCAAGPPGPNAKERAHFVDAFSAPAGLRPWPDALAVGGTQSLEEAVAAVEGLLGHEWQQPALVVVDSLSVLALGSSRERFFASFRRLVGLVRARAAVGLFALEPEAHAPEDLPVLARLAGGVLRLAAEHDGHVLSLERPDRARTPWTEYTFGEDHFDVTGSFHATRIR